MYPLHYAKLAVVFFLLLVSMSINLEDNLIARVGMPGGYGAAFLVAVTMTVLLSGRSPALVALAIIFSINANMPMDLSLNFGIDRDIYCGFMVSFLIVPFIERIVD